MQNSCCDHRIFDNVNHPFISIFLPSIFKFTLKTQRSIFIFHHDTGWQQINKIEKCSFIFVLVMAHLFLASVILSLFQESGDLKQRFDDVSKLYNDTLEEQRKFRERTEKAWKSAQNIKLSLTQKLTDIQSKLNCVHNMNDIS
jgi:hypothetical protein